MHVLGALQLHSFGSPTPGTVALSASGLTLDVTRSALVTNGNPVPQECTVTVHSDPLDSAAPQSRAVSTDAGSLTFTGRPATTYRARKTCTGGRVSAGSVTSDPVTTTV